jgi:hypothetical protein
MVFTIPLTFRRIVLYSITIEVLGLVKKQLYVFGLQALPTREITSQNHELIFLQPLICSYINLWTMDNRRSATICSVIVIKQSDLTQTIAHRQIN